MKKTVCVLFLCFIVINPSLLAAQETTQKYTDIMNERTPAAVSAFNKALAFDNEGEQLKAIEAYEQAIRLHPLVKEAYNNLGAIYADVGMYDRAIDNYKTAIKLDKRFGVAHFNLGMAYYALGRYNDAIKVFEAGSESSPQVKDVLYFLGRSYSHVGNYDKAIECFEKVLKYDQDFYAAHFDIACAYMVTNKFNKALYHFNMVLLIVPHHENAERIRTIITNIEKIDLKRVELRSVT